MTKEHENNNESNEWEFPEIDSYNGFDEGKFDADLESDDSSISPIENDVVGNELARKKKHDNHNETILKEKEELLQKKELELNEKYNLITSILTKMQDPLIFFDDQLIHIVQDIIKKIIIKIIQKEITSDPSIVIKMIDGLKTLINTHDGLVNISLSEDDFKTMQTVSEDKNQSIHVDPSLTRGDIIIKTNDNEIRALLSERVDLLMGTLHE